ncbi:MAG: quinoprotein relay system zinc metallohydrolase 1 [Campylobacteraceae bacterium]|nr:quinoprotein relay system zinc metallohydrolase 1 [Campylobacteraceae bacterium]
MKIFLILIFTIFTLNAKQFYFKLKAVKIAKDTYMFEGKEEYFSIQNGGDISNTYFIIAQDSILVIDSGTSYYYGLQMIKEIRKLSQKKIKYLINTHHHPDHFLGNQAFKDSIILANKYTKEYIEKNGNEYIVALINITQYALSETKSVAPSKVLKDSYIDLKNHKLKILNLKGHTKKDTVIYDENTKTLFVSDLVFNNRAAATPHANIKEWIKTLKRLRKIPYKILASGHGKISYTKDPINQMISYLFYLDKKLKSSALKGLSVFEILALEKPKEFLGISMIDEEFERSIINLYPKYEDKIK